MPMIKYKIRTIKNCWGDVVDDTYECVRGLDLDNGTKTYDINRIFNYYEVIVKSNPKGIYEVVEIDE